MAWDDQLKGVGRRLLMLADEGLTLQLISFQDGSLGLIRNGEFLGLWERDEEADCLAEFVQAGGGQNLFRDTLIVLRHAPTEPSITCANVLQN